jgi:hypothetical protein
MTDSIQDRRAVFTGDTVVSKFLDKWDRDVPPERRTYGVKVCLAGAEGKSFRDGLYRVGVRHILVSYYYLRKWLCKHSVEEISTDLGRFDYLILDSGGFTLLQEAKNNPDMAVDVRGYAEEYYAELKRIGHLFSMCAEVDLPDKVGIDYSEGIKRELLSGGIHIVPVMQGQPIEYFERLRWFDTYPYIAVGSACIGPPKFKGWLRDIFLKGQACGNLFHGFGATTDEVLAKHQFYSVDSTTWLDGGKFGTTMIYENGRLRYYDMEYKAVRNKYKRMFEENGLVFNDIKNDKALEVNMMNAVAWRQLGEGLKYDTRNSYWLSDEEKRKAADIRVEIYNENGLIDRSKSIVRADVRRKEILKDARRDDRVHEPLHCDICNFVGKCPRYKRGSTCGYDINLQIETEQDLHNAMKVLFEAAFGRVMNGILFEKLHGGALDKNVSAELRNVVGIIKDLREIYRPKTARGDDDGESFTLTGKASSGGVLSQMLSKVFGGEEDTMADGETINVTPARETQE